MVRKKKKLFSIINFPLSVQNIRKEITVNCPSWAKVHKFKEHLQGIMIKEENDTNFIFVSFYQ